ncbi:MAG: PKD domain-containing protein [Bacteroidota bacterium]
MKKTTAFLTRFTTFVVLAILAYSCGDPVPEPTLQVFSSVDGYQVAFTATATNADSYAWDFGDGETSTEQNPVHTYASSGSFTATCTVTGEGGTADASTEVTIAASEMEMLTGGSSMADGKTWVFSPTASEGDGIYYANADMEFQEPLPDGILGLIGLPSEYEDEFIFKHDGTYTHDVKNDSVVTDLVFAMLNQLEYRPSAEDVVVLCPFTPAAATFTYAEAAGLTLEVTDQDTPEESSDVTWDGVTVLEIAGGEFIGVMDFTRKYIVFEITPDKMVLGIFISTTAGSKADKPTHFLRMTFVPKS